jgi:hypothetical protein
MFLAIRCFSFGRSLQLGYESEFSGFRGLQRTSSFQSGGLFEKWLLFNLLFADALTHFLLPTGSI